MNEQLSFFYVDIVPVVAYRMSCNAIEFYAVQFKSRNNGHDCAELVKFNLVNIFETLDY